MFFRVTQMAITTCLAFFMSLAFAGPQQKSEQKWVPYSIRGLFLAPGAPAFFLVLETQTAACASWEDKIQCEQAWNQLPNGFTSMGDEVQYTRIHNGSSQQVRVGQPSFCIMAWATGRLNDASACDDLWEAFVKEKAETAI